MGSLHRSDSFAEVDIVTAAPAWDGECDRAGLEECRDSGYGFESAWKMVKSSPVSKLDSSNGRGSIDTLVLGTLVEVRHREIGYRGSWHPARVVKIDSRGGLVEYENLVSKDGLLHYQEYVPLSEGVEVLLRPRPPPVAGKSQEVWQRGLWVDAYYGNAWWEGVLMEDFHLRHGQMQVFFPDEGDRRGFGRHSLRVSQEWDLKTGTWRQKGQWTELASIEGRKFRLKRTFAVKPKRSGDSPSETIEVSDMRKRKREEESSDDTDDTNDDETIYDWCRRHRKRLPLRKDTRPDGSNDASDLKTSLDVNSDGPFNASFERAEGNLLTKEENDENLAKGGSDAAGSDLISKEVENRTGTENQNIQSMIVRSGLSPLATKIEYLRMQMKQMGGREGEKEEIINETAGKMFCQPVPVQIVEPRRNPVLSLEDPSLVDAKGKARGLLKESGWTDAYRVRDRFGRLAVEPYYVSPEGRPYMSLSTACREWLRRNKHLKATKARTKFSPLQLVARASYGFLPCESGQAVSRRQTRTAREEPAQESHKQKKLTKKGRSRTGCKLEALRPSSTPSRQEDEAEVSSIKRMTLFSWLIENRVLREHEPVHYLNTETNVSHSGNITSDGILCSCCMKVVSISDFQEHAGGMYRGASQIRLKDGRSILDCQLAGLKAMEMRESELITEDIPDIDENDDTCAICGDGGQLVCCDHCPSTFHLKCLCIEKVPEGDWFCPRCCCACCSRSLYDPATKSNILYCEQCEREYHSDCIPGGSLRHDDQFCSRKCMKVFKGLRKLVGRVNKIDDVYSWSLLRSERCDPSAEISKLETAVDINSRLALALNVFQECFRPMIDPRSKIDMLSHILYNRRGEDKRLDFRGFYAVLLQREQELVSVASIRVHGTHAAEIPFIGTRSQYRKQGMCRRLMNVIEQVLQAVEVQTLVLPAIAEFIETWTTAFGFQRLAATQGIQLMELNIVTFPGSSLLQKPLTWLQCGRKLAPVAEEIACLSLLEEESSAEETENEQSVRKPKPKQTPTLQLQLESKGHSAKKSRVLPGAISIVSPDSSEGEEATEVPDQVVTATTRSNRLVRSPPWVANGVKSLRRKSETKLKQAEISASQEQNEHNHRLHQKKNKSPDEWIEEQTRRTSEVKSPTRTFSRRSRPQLSEDEGVNSRNTTIHGSNSKAKAKTVASKWPKAKRSPRDCKPRVKFSILEREVSLRRSLRSRKI